MLIKGKTSEGFEFAVDEEARDDMELLEGLVAMDRGEMTAAPAVVTALLGDEQKKALYEFCRAENGRVSTKKVMATIADIFKTIRKMGESDTKN